MIAGCVIFAIVLIAFGEESAWPVVVALTTSLCIAASAALFWEWDPDEQPTWEGIVVRLLGLPLMMIAIVSLLAVAFALSIILNLMLVVGLILGIATITWRFFRDGH